MPTRLRIRQMKLDDIPAVVRVANQAFLEGARRPKIGSRLVEHLTVWPGWSFVAEVRGESVGFLASRADPKQKQAQISWIAVHPNFWGRGVGGRLLSAIEKKAVRAKFAKVVTGTPFARKFYEKYGYTCRKIIHALVKDITRSESKKDTRLKMKQADLEDLPLVIESWDRRKARECLKVFFDIYEADQDKILLGFKQGKLVGGILGAAHERIPDLAEIRFLYGEDRGVQSGLIRNFEYQCSKKGMRWVGIIAGPGWLLKWLKENGYQEAKMDEWWSSYRMVKDL